VTLSEILAIVIPSLLAIAGALWGVFRIALGNQEKHQDERHAATQKALDEANAAFDEKTTGTKKAIWDRLDEVAKEISGIKIAQAALLGRLDAMPTDSEVDGVKLAMATLMGRLEAIPTRDYIDQAMDKLRADMNRRLDLMAD
jgi:hypothetical protein